MIANAQLNGIDLSALLQALGWAITEEAAFAWAVKCARPYEPLEGINYRGVEYPKPEFRDGIAIIPIYGEMIKGAGPRDEFFGALPDEKVISWLGNLPANTSGVLLDINSPGGTSMGSPEFHAVVKTIRNRMPVVAYTDGLMASKAYGVGATAHYAFATPSAGIGSIGTIMVNTNLSRMLQNAGIDMRVFASGDLKAAGNPFVPMTDEHRDYLQDFAEQHGAMFRDHVRAMRPAVQNSAMRGQLMLGRKAAEARLIDAVVSGRSEAIEILDGLTR